MKTSRTLFRSLVLIGLITFFACRKDATALQNDTTLTGPSLADTIAPKSAVAATVATPLSTTASPNCGYAPDYGDSILHSQSAGGQDYLVSPINNKSVTGRYFAWPGGLVIDTVSGTINVTQSENGQRYAIGFARDGGNDTCVSVVILGGADYIDSAYVVNSGSLSAPPLFNANPNEVNPCGSGGCAFDYDNAAKNQGVYIDASTGKIDLQYTLDHSLFSLWSPDGAYLYTTVHYKTSLAGNIPQSIDLKMVYYNHKSDVPAGLLSAVQTQAYTTSNGLMSVQAKSRPPIIIITRYN